MSGPVVETPARASAVKHEDLKLGDRYQVSFRPPGSIVQWLPARLVGFQPATETQAARYLFQGHSWSTLVPAAELTTRVRALALDRFVIHAPSEAHSEDGDSGFWSNDTGWTRLADATRYSHAEITTLQLPVASAADARWLSENQAKAMVMFEEIVIDGLVALRGNGTAAVVFNNLIGANRVDGYDDYLTCMQRDLGITPLRGRRIEYRLRGVTNSATVIPSTQPEAHRVHGGAP